MAGGRSYESLHYEMTMINMSKNVNKTIKFNGSVKEVIKMFQDETYLISKSRHAASHSFKIDTNSDEISIHLERIFDLRDEVPSIIRKIVGNDLTLVQEETWTKNSDGSYTGSIELRVDSLKAIGSLKAHLRASGDESELSLEGKIKSSKAIFGGQIEDYAAEYIDEVLQDEQDDGNEWLEMNP